MRRKLRTLKDMYAADVSTADCIIVCCSVYADVDGSQCRGQSDVAQDCFP